MFAYDTVIDQVQNSKKQFVKIFVTDEKIASTLNEFIDSQTGYTKSAAKAALDASTNLIHATIKHVQEAAQFDYNKFGEGMMKAYMTMPGTKTHA